MFIFKKWIDECTEKKIKNIVRRVFCGHMNEYYTSVDILFEKILMKCYFNPEFQRLFVDGINKFILYENDESEDINECYYNIENVLNYDGKKSFASPI